MRLSLVPRLREGDCPRDERYQSLPARGDALHQRAGRLARHTRQTPGPQLRAERRVDYARINEAECIGCTLCIAACPVDAIVGSGKLMQTIIENECTGSELCLPPCPVDCITLAPCAPFDGPSPWPDLAPEKAERARVRIANRKERLGAPAPTTVSPGHASLESRRAEIAASVKRRRNQRQRADASRPQ